VSKWLPARANKASSTVQASSKNSIPEVAQPPAKRQEPAASPASQLADDLIRRIVAAIDEWSAANNLSNLPRKIVFEQALAIMNALYGVNVSSTRKKER